MSVAEPAMRFGRCRNCSEVVEWSLPLAVWVHQATGERACGLVEVRG